MNRALLGDCLELMKDIPDSSIDLLLTDPPYKVITGGNGNGKNSIRPKGILTKNKELMNIIPEFKDWLPEAYRVLKEGSHAYIMTNSSNLLSIGREIENAGFKISNFLVWQKNNCTPSQYYMKNCEYTIFCRKGKAKYINNIGGSKTVHQIDNVSGKIHPTEKPVRLMEFYLLNSSSEGDVILDPFCGSGTTAVACLNTKRNFICMEIDEDYFNVASQRIAQFGEYSKPEKIIETNQKQLF